MTERMEDSLVRIGEAESPPPTGKLRRELSIWEAVGVSLALMAPSMAANINPQGSALTVGRAVPLTFVLATIGVLLVAYTFVRLCQQFHHAGSVYGFVGATLGPRAGVVSGWSLWERTGSTASSRPWPRGSSEPRSWTTSACGTTSPTGRGS